MTGGTYFKDILSGIPGRHNVENAIAAAAVANRLGISMQPIIRCIETFQGVRRRFDFRIREKGRVYIDDYAHHPKELEAFIMAVKELYPKNKITGLFQPHLFSRTRDFADGFAAVLDLLDVPWLLDIYPARELPIPGITSGVILEAMKNPNKELLSREAVFARLATDKPEVFLTIGAGDIDQMAEPIEHLLRS
jgi:UDP-N-acetylmuramate--alanine ligase